MGYFLQTIYCKSLKNGTLKILTAIVLEWNKLCYNTVKSNNMQIEWHTVRTLDQAFLTTVYLAFRQIAYPPKHFEKLQQNCMVPHLLIHRIIQHYCFLNDKRRLGL